MRWTILLFAGPMLAATDGCVGSVGVTTFRLVSAPPTGNSWVQVRQLNNVPAGYRVRYNPVDLPADMKKDAKLTLVMAPRPGEGQITVLEPRPAANPTDWVAPFAPSVMLVVFAPQGLDEKRLTNLVTRDDSLVAALGDYADQTADLE